MSDSDHSGRRDQYKRLKKVTSKSNIFTDNHVNDQLEEFDWSTNSVRGVEYIKPIPMVVAGLLESEDDRKTKYINNLYTTCMTCSICDIGINNVGRDGIYRDPHLLSNRNVPSKYILVSDRPTWDDLSYRDNQIAKSSLEQALESRGLDKLLYVTYLLKCGAEGNDKEYYDNCKSYLDLEMRIIKPTLIISVGRSPFEFLKSDPEASYEDNMRKIISSKFRIKMLVISDVTDVKFEDHLRAVGQLVERLNKK